MIDRFLSPYAEDAACQLDCLGDCSSFKGWGFFPSLDVNYIYLGEEERSRFAANTHEYLITQLQRSLHLGIVGQKLLDLQFQHPVKYIAWIARRDDCSYRNQWENYTNWLWCDISPFSASSAALRAFFFASNLMKYECKVSIFILRLDLSDIYKFIVK